MKWSVVQINQNPRVTHTEGEYLFHPACQLAWTVDCVKLYDKQNIINIDAQHNTPCDL